MFSNWFNLFLISVFLIKVEEIQKLQYLEYFNIRENNFC